MPSGSNTPAGNAHPAHRMFPQGAASLVTGSSTDIPPQTIAERNPSRERLPQSLGSIRENMSEKIVIGNVPTMASQIKVWKESVRNGCAGCAVDGDLAWKWAKSVEKVGLTIHDFATSHAQVSPEYNHQLNRLDHKLKQTLMNHLTGSLGQAS